MSWCRPSCAGLQIGPKSISVSTLACSLTCYLPGLTELGRPSLYCKQHAVAWPAPENVSFPRDRSFGVSSVCFQLGRSEQRRSTRKCSQAGPYLGLKLELQTHRAKRSAQPKDGSAFFPHWADHSRPPGGWRSNSLSNKMLVQFF